MIAALTPFLLLLTVGSVWAQIPYQTLPSQTWSQQFYSQDGTAQVSITGVCVDLLNNTFAVGWVGGNFETHTTAGVSTAVVMKFSSTGSRLFIRYLDSLQGDDASSCQTDSTGGVYVTGRTYGYLSTLSDSRDNSGLWDVFVAHFDSIGTLNWVRQLQSVVQDNAAGFGIQTDSSDNAYCLLMKGSSRLGMVKLNKTGSVLGSTFAIGSQSQASYLGYNTYSYWNSNPGVTTSIFETGDFNGNNLACDSFGTCYVAYAASGGATATNGTVTGDVDVYLTKLDSIGNIQWTLTTGSTKADYVYSVAIDTSNNIWIGGATSGVMNGQTPFGNSDAFVVKVSPTAEILFTRVFGTIHDDAVESMVTDARGGMYLIVDQHFLGCCSASPLGDFIDNIAGTYRYDARFAYVMEMDSYGNRLWESILSAGAISGDTGSYQFVMTPKTTAVTADGSGLVVGGKYSGIFNEDFSQFPNSIGQSKGFIFYANPQASCNATDFSSVMSEINDLLTSLDM